MKSPLLLLVLTLLLAACQNAEPKEPVILKVAYPFAQKLYRDYGFGFEKKYPHIQIQVASDSPESGSDADIVYFQSLAEFREQIERGALVSLAVRYRDDKELERVSPIVTTLLSSAADNGELYGAAPSFEGTGVFYNKDLFAKYGVESPRSGMSWKDLLALAARFPRENDEGERLYGFDSNYTVNASLKFWLEAGRTEGLSYLQPPSGKVTINTERWRILLEGIIGSLRSAALFEGDSPTEPFLTGHAAMKLGNLSSAYNFEQFAKMGTSSPVNWAVSAPPSDPGQPDRSRYYELHHIFAISAQSPHPEEAWELLRFMLADTDNIREMADVSNKGIPSITDYLRPMAGKESLSGLYALDAEPRDPNPYGWADADLVNALQEAMAPAFEQAIRGELTVEQALAAMEQAGQLAVDAKLTK
jgi:ABC-type glycerol-3-phosphate transport system substrate-binding protein